MFHWLTSSLPVRTPLHLGCKETPAHRHLHSQHAADGEINCTAHGGMPVIYGKLWRCGHNMQRCMREGLQTKWAIIWNSTLGLKTKGGSPRLVTKGNEGSERSHICRLWWCSYKCFPPISPPLPPSSYSSCLFLNRHIPTLQPERVWVPLSVVTLSTLTAEQGRG